MSGTHFDPDRVGGSSRPDAMVPSELFSASFPLPLFSVDSLLRGEIAQRERSFRRTHSSRLSPVLAEGLLHGSLCPQFWASQMSTEQMLGPGAD